MSRPAIGSVPLVFAVSATLILATNDTFWRKGASDFAGHEAQLAGLGIGLFLLVLATLATLSVKDLVKPVLIAAILLSAAAARFVDGYGLLIDRKTITNLFQTSRAEAGGLMTPGFFVDMALYGLLPAALVAVVRIRHRNAWGKFRQNSLVVFPAPALTLGIVALCYPGFASTFRTRRDLLASLNSGAPLAAIGSYARQRLGERDDVVAPLGRDARPGAAARRRAAPGRHASRRRRDGAQRRVRPERL